MAVALRHVGVVVSDLKKALDLYRSYLGCELVAEYPRLVGEYQDRLVGISQVEMNVAIVRTKDGHRIELLEYHSHPRKRSEPVEANEIGVSHLALAVDDLQGLYEMRERYEVKFVSPPLTSPDGRVRVAYAVLMDEHIVELVQVLKFPP